MIDNIQKIISSYDYNEVVIHSDISRGFLINEKTREGYLNKTLNILFDIFQSKEIIMPTFNYDFLTTQKYDLANDPSQVGILNEYFRLNYSNWRTKVPVFSYSGTGLDPRINLDSMINPFNENSIFNFFYEKNSLFFLYGAGFKSSTLIHYIETSFKKIRYRYLKYFKGIILDHTNSYEVQLEYLVRPLNIYSEYDWNKIENDLINNNIIRKYEEGRSFFLFYQTKDIVDFILNKLINDDMYLLNEKSKKIAFECFKKNKKNYFDINDFE